MDPPYYENLFEECLLSISKNNILKEDGIIVVEHDTKEILNEKINDLEKFRYKSYGNTTLSFYRIGENNE